MISQTEAFIHAHNDISDENRDLCRVEDTLVRIRGRVRGLRRPNEGFESINPFYCCLRDVTLDIGENPY